MIPIEYFKTSLLVLIAWSVVGALLTGLGSLVLRLDREPARGIDHLFLSFWIGWVCLLFILEIWHLFLPVSGYTFSSVAVIGTVGLALLGRSFRPALRRHWLDHLPSLVLLALFALCLSNLALAGARHGDTGAYFIPTVKWVTEHPIVPGLGNLSVLLGFNQSHFLYVAFLDIGPFAGHSHHLANGLLILVLAARGLLGASRLFRWRHACKPQDVFYAVLLPAATSLGFGIFMTSPSPDLPVLVLGLVLTGQLLAFLSPPRVHRNAFDLAVLALVAVGGVKVKQSFGGLAAATLAVAGVSYLWKMRSEWRRSLAAVAAAAAIGLITFSPWIARSIILTGYPFYPSSAFAMPVEWRVSVDWESWAGDIMRLSIWEAFSAPRVFLHRLDTLGWAKREVVVPLSVAVAATATGLVAVCVRSLRRRKSLPRQVSLLILLPTAASFVFCLANAPMARYFGSVFWLLAAEAVLLAVGGSIYAPDRRYRRASLAAVCVVAACVPVFLERSALAKRSRFQGSSAAEVKEVRLATGLSVNVPLRRCSCWAAPLPCTPSPNQALRLRRPGELRSGFVLDPEIEWARHPEGDPRCQMGKPRQNSG